MTLSDKEKIKRLEHTFELNWKITRLYANYLELFPELITKKMVDELTSDVRITESDAVVAIICEAFGLDDARGGDERRLIRDYIRQSVKILDTKKYTENKYYKNIKIPEVKHGSWELKQEFYEPYRAVIGSDIIINEDFSEIPPLAFFTERFYFPAVLEDGNEWMTLTPVDLDTCEEAIASAHGRVITFGLGLGYFAYMASEKEEVDSVTVIERSDKVIDLFKEYILPQFAHPEKIRIINEDAFVYMEEDMPRENYDYAFVDIWRDASDGAPIYEKMKPLEKLCPGTKFDYWIESFLISRIRAERFLRLTGDGRERSYEDFVKELKDGTDI